MIGASQHLVFYHSTEYTCWSSRLQPPFRHNSDHVGLLPTTVPPFKAHEQCEPANLNQHLLVWLISCKQLTIFALASLAALDFVFLVPETFSKTLQTSLPAHCLQLPDLHSMRPKADVFRRFEPLNCRSACGVRSCPQRHELFVLKISHNYPTIVWYCTACSLCQIIRKWGRYQLSQRRTIVGHQQYQSRVSGVRP